ncbi:hypothetical protein Dimus_015205 [Dionaea muscipula]
MAPKPKEKGKPAPSSDSIEKLFTSLNELINKSDYEKAVKVADEVLSIAPGDEDAIRCKIVALIKDDNIEDALKSIEYARNLPIDLIFLKAYCLYRQNKLDEALNCLRSQEKNTTNMLLESQILYRLGKIDDSLKIYQSLQKSKIDFLETNYVAALVSAGQASEVHKVLDAFNVKATSTFELAFNTACSLVDMNKHKDAEQLLLSARRVGQETLMGENLADDEIEIELAPIAVQLAYVYQLLGQTQEAMNGYLDIIRKNLPDEPSLAVAVNNLVVLKGPKDISDSLKKLDRFIEKGDHGQFQLARGLDSKFSAKQKEVIYANRALLLLHANRMDQARELVTALQGMFPDSVMPVLLQAAVFVRENKAVRAEEMLGQFAEKFPDKSKVLLLAKAQVAAAAGHPLVAAESLAQIPDIQYMPATVATIVALKERAGDIDGANAAFDTAIKWWSNAMTEDKMLSVIMPKAASFKLKHGRAKEAFHLFEELVKSHGSVDAMVGLVTTAAHVDVEKAEAYEKQLKPLPGLKGIDVDSLEKTSGAKPAESGSRTGTVEMHEDTKNKERAKKKRKRKPRYPKGFNPANPGPPPDPERWLPKRERSSYRPKRKDKRTAHVRGSQGAVVREKHDAVAPDPSSRSGMDSSDSNTVNPKSNQPSTSKGSAQNAGPSKSSKKKSRKK